MFAIVHVGGTQYKVSVDDTIVTQKLEADIGSEVCSEH
jgi:ribosomal protein L21